jgi:hypothetical protein
VNERRDRGFFLPMDSMMNILPEQPLLISDVRQNGSAPHLLPFQACGFT